MNPLPIELILAIVDQSARHDAHAGSQLALVSKAVSYDAIRALYDVVYLRTWRSTCAFGRHLASASHSATCGLLHVRHLSAPFMRDTTVSMLGSQCPNLTTLQLYCLPPGGVLKKRVDLFIMSNHSGVIDRTNAFAFVHFHSTARLLPAVQSRPSRLITHFSMTHRFEEHSSAALASVRTILSYPCLEVLVVRVSTIARTLEQMVEKERNVKRTLIWRGLKELEDTRIRAGVYFIIREPGQAQMVSLWEAHARKTESIWNWGEQVWVGDD